MVKKLLQNTLYTITKYNSSRIILKSILITCLFITMITSPVYGHSGRTDSNGGHHVTATGEYHYHHGYPAHQHPNGICPYVDSTKNNSGLDLNSDSLILFIICLSGGIWGIFFIKSSITKFKNKQRFKRKRLYYLNLYKGKSIYELANVPENIKFDENDLPISVDNSGLKWGKEFTVYVSKYGKCYHKKYGCSGAYNYVHIFTGNIKYWSCSRCSHGESYEIPTWYNDYLEIKKTKKYYGI